jgi:hypothetical protein
MGMVSLRDRIHAHSVRTEENKEEKGRERKENRYHKGLRLNAVEPASGTSRWY